MKAVVFYESADDLAEKAPLHAGPHRARWREFADRGDPFVLHGVVRNWTIREWNEALVPDNPGKPDK